jgi:hypothetical protein
MKIKYTLDPIPDWETRPISWEGSDPVPELDELGFEEAFAAEQTERAWFSEVKKRGGNPDALRKHFATDPEIKWGTKDSFDRCVQKASKHMTEEQAKGFCNLRHKDATGHYAGEKYSKKK